MSHADAELNDSFGVPNPRSFRTVAERPESAHTLPGQPDHRGTAAGIADCSPTQAPDNLLACEFHMAILPTLIGASRERIRPVKHDVVVEIGRAELLAAGLARNPPNGLPRTRKP